MCDETSWCTPPPKFNICPRTCDETSSSNPPPPKNLTSTPERVWWGLLKHPPPPIFFFYICPRTCVMKPPQASPPPKNLTFALEHVWWGLLKHPPSPLPNLVLSTSLCDFCHTIEMWANTSKSNKMTGRGRKRTCLILFLLTGIICHTRSDSIQSHDLNQLSRRKMPFNADYGWAFSSHVQISCHNTNLSHVLKEFIHSYILWLCAVEFSIPIDQN